MSPPEEDRAARSPIDVALDILTRQLLMVQDSAQAALGTIALIRGGRPPAQRSGGKAEPYVFGETQPLTDGNTAAQVMDLTDRIKRAADQYAGQDAHSAPTGRRRARGHGRTRSP